MAYVAPTNQMALLANAFSGAAKGAQDFAQLKLKRDAMRQDQAQHDDRISMALQQLDVQISEANLDREATAELQGARLAIEAKLEREGFIEAHKRTVTQAAVGHGRTAERTRQFNYLQAQAAQQDNAILQYVNSLPPLPEPPAPIQAIKGKATPDQMAEIERLTVASRQATANRAAAVAEQTDWLAGQMSGSSGEVTPALSKTANAIISNKQGFSDRVYTRAQQTALAKLGRYAGGPWAGARRTASGYDTPYGTIPSAASGMVPFEVPYQNRQFAATHDGANFATKEQYQSIMSGAPGEKMRAMREQFETEGMTEYALERIDANGLAARFEVALVGMDDRRTATARTLMDDWNDNLAAYQNRETNKANTKVHEETFLRTSMMLDTLLENDNKQFVRAANTSMQYARDAHHEKKVPSSGLWAQWESGTARSTGEYTGPGSVANRLQDALRGTEGTVNRLTDDYDYEDKIIAAWDGAVQAGDIRKWAHPDSPEAMQGRAAGMNDELIRQLEGMLRAAVARGDSASARDNLVDLKASEQEASQIISQLNELRSSGNR